MASGHGGARPNAGRPKGSEAKTTTALKDAILLAAEEHGMDGQGEDGLKGYLRAVARDDQKTFCGLLGRVLPLKMTGEDNGPVKLVVEWAQPNSE